MQTVFRLNLKAFSQEDERAALWRMAWPLVVLQSIQIANMLLDRFYIGHLQAEALTAYGGAMSAMFFVFSIALSLATAATAIVSRAYGADEHGKARMAGSQCLSLSLIIGSVVALIGLNVFGGYSQWVLGSSSSEAARLMGSFLGIYAFALPMVFISQSVAGTLRAIGNTRAQMRVSIVQIVIHALLNIVLIPPTRTVLGVPIPGANLGLNGAAYALVISYAIAALIFIYVLRRAYYQEASIWRALSWSWVRRILRVAIPAAGGAMVQVFAFTAFIITLSHLPESATAIAAFSIVLPIESILFLPGIALSAAIASLVGQSLGMNEVQRGERITKLGLLIGSISCVILSLIALLLSSFIANVFVGENPQVASEAVTMLRIVCLTEVFYVIALILTGAMQGAGDTVRPMWASLGILLIGRTILVASLSLSKNVVIANIFPMLWGTGWGSYGAWLGYAFSYPAFALLLWLMYRSKAWQNQKI